MGRKDRISIASEKRVTYEGTYQFKELYSHVRNYLEIDKHYDVTEVDLDEKDKNGERMLLTKIDAQVQFNDYYKINIRFTLEMKGNDVEVELNGRKCTATKGMAQLSINSYIIPDYLDKRDAGPLAEFMGKLYDKYIGKEELSKAIGQTVSDVNALIAFFKREVKSAV